MFSIGDLICYIFGGLSLIGFISYCILQHIDFMREYKWLLRLSFLFLGLSIFFML
jgi:ABC-type multidrug transport system permease subunit